MYDPPTLVWPNYPGSGASKRINKEDGQGGIIASWATNSGIADGNWAQRVDAQGNICWGDSALRVFPYGEAQYDFCSDGLGGWFFTTVTFSFVTYSTSIFLQHVNAEGQMTLPDSGLAIHTSATGLQSPRIAPDGNGGFFLVWQDFRPPYSTFGAGYRQHYDAQYQPTWSDDGILIAPNFWGYELFPDGEGGLIVHGAPNNSYYKDVYRYSPNGNLMWELPQISEGMFTATMIPGEPGFFYIGWSIWANATVYAQRIDIEGNIYWPTSGPGTGAIITQSDEFDITEEQSSFGFHYPYFYAMYVYYDEFTPYMPPNYLFAQSLSLEGERRWGEAGTFFAEVIDTGYVWVPTNIVPDEQGGAVPVWYLKQVYQVYAKHIRDDGSIGGPTWPPPYEYQPGEPNLSVSNQTVHYTLSIPGEISIGLYNLLGRQLSSTSFFHQQAGVYTAPLPIDGLSSGIYFLRVAMPVGEAVKKVAVVR
ncbi:T9SS type A sorting domain-containing protein [bacterium]|nr:T9SS type A sorting domain-containing protein [bacterium]